jgi:hypothetical protein
MIVKDKFLEYAEYVGNYYGTPKAFVDKKLEEGKKKFESNPKLYPLVVYSKELKRVAAAYGDGRVIFWYWTVERKPLDTPLD